MSWRAGDPAASSAAGDRRAGRVTWALLAAALLALVLLAAALPGLRLAPGKPLPVDLLPGLTVSPETPGGGSVRVGWLPLLFVAGAGFVVLTTLLSARFRRWLWRALPVYGLVLLAFYLLLANLRLPELAGTGPAAPGGDTTSAPGPLPLPAPVAVPELVTNPPGWLVSAVSVAIAAGLVALLWRALGRRRARAGAGRDALADLAAEARAALEGLERGADLHDTVLRCYAEMERILWAERGLERGAAVTPREFERRLAHAGLDDGSIRRLTRLFERVRYSPRGTGEREGREAEECLRAIVAAYGAGASGRASGAGRPRP